jgi:modulator of FtsH protease
MEALDLEHWHDFFVASAGASAGLVGLVFVAISINLKQILERPGQAERAGETVIPLASVLLISLVALVPGLGIRTFGWELVVFGGLAWLVTTRIELKALKNRHYMRALHIWSRIVINQPANLLVVIGGLSLLMGFGGGLTWMAAGAIFSFAGALLNAWVLLIEILR